jgi:hypothetical protein
MVINMADIRRRVSEFVTEGRELCQLMRSSEKRMLTRVDLHVLRAQLHLVDSEAINLESLQKFWTKDP